MATAGIYVRVSSKGQQEEGASLKTQEEACRTYCERLGLPVFHVYSDAASAGNHHDDGEPKDSLDRPGLDALRDDVAADLVSHVVIHSSDRLTRSVSHRLILRREWRGIELHFVLGGKHEDESPGGKFSSTILAAADEYARDNIRERVRRGRLGKARRGKVSLNDIAPYGYRLGGEKADWLEVIPEEADIIRHIFELYALPGSSSLTGVCNALKGVPTPSESGHAPAGFAKHHKKAPGVWGESTIRAILENRLYGFGEWTYRKTLIDPVTSERMRVAPENRIIVSGLPTIVRPDIQEAALRRLVENRLRRDNKRKVPYPLSGYIVCGSCGLAWTGFFTPYKGKAHRYYRCQGKAAARSLDGETRRCDVKNVRADHLEQLIVEYIRQFLQTVGEKTDPKFWLNEIQKRQGERPDYDAQLATIAGKRSRLLAALEAAGKGESARVIGDRMAVLDEDALRIRREMSADTDAEKVRYTLEQVRAGWKTAADRIRPEDLPKFLQATGTVIRIEADRTLRVLLGAKLQAGVPVCLTVNKLIDVDAWGNIVDEGGHPVG